MYVKECVHECWLVNVLISNKNQNQLKKMFLLNFALVVLMSTVLPNTKGKHDLRPTIALDSLQLRLLCDEQELAEQLRPIRFNWLTCLGIRRLFLPTEVETLSESDRLKLAQLLALPDDSLNPYCLLGQRWKSCMHHLTTVSCLIANADAIESASDPKYTPLHRPSVRWRRKRSVGGSSHDVEYYPVPVGRTSDGIDRQAELFRLHCESIRTQQRFQTAPGGRYQQQRKETSDSNLASEFGHLFTVPGNEIDVTEKADKLKAKAKKNKKKSSASEL